MPKIDKYYCPANLAYRLIKKTDVIVVVESRRKCIADIKVKVATEAIKELYGMAELCAKFHPFGATVSCGI